MGDHKLDSAQMARLAERVASDRDRDAFAVLFDYFAPRIKTYVMKLGLDAGQSEELTQEVMIVLWHKAALFDPSKSSLPTWIYRVARNRRIDMARRNRSAQMDENDPLLQPEPEPLPDSGLDAGKRQARLREAMKQLPGEQYEIIRLSFFLGRSHSQIAEETGLAVGTVKSRIRLAFNRLRTTLEADPEIDAP